MFSPAFFISVGACLLASITVGWTVPTDELQSIAVQFPQNAEQTFDQALREAFLTAIQHMMPPYPEDDARQYTSTIIREADKIHESWRNTFNELSRQVTTAQKVWQQASKELGDALEKISNLQAEILKKNREYHEAQEIDAEYQRQVATASKWQIVVPLDVTYPYTMPRGQALDTIQNVQLERLIELGRGVHLQAVDLVEQGELKQSVVLASVSGKLIPEGETVIQHVEHPRRDQRRIIAVRTFSVLPLMNDEQLHKPSNTSKAPETVILNNHTLQALDVHEEASTTFIAQFSSPHDQEIYNMISRAMEHNKKTSESVSQIMKDWERIRPTINLSVIKDEINKAETALASEQSGVAVLEEKEKALKAEKNEAENIYKAHLDSFRIFLNKSGIINVGELDVIKVTLKKALELYEALKVEANESRYRSMARIENFALAEESIQQKFRNLRLLELRLLPIGSRINAEGHEIISLTLLGTYGLNSADSNESPPMTAALPPTPGTEVGQSQDPQNAADTSRAVPGAQQEGPQRPEAPGQLAREQVRLVQLQLQTLGLNPGPADGIYGRQTEAAVRQFQARHALPSTGWPDEATRRALEREASEVPPRQPARPTQHAEKQRSTSEPERILNEVGGFFQRIFERK
jgi:hypothetical protein